MNLNKLSKLKPVIGLIAIALSVSACGTGTGGTTVNPVINNVQGPIVTFANGNFIMSAVIENVSVEGGITVPIPHMPNSTIEVGPDLQTNGLLLSVSLSDTDLAALTGADLLDPQELPDGRALPGVTTGELPAIAVEVPQWDNVVFYVGPTVFGVFVPVTLGMQGYEATFNFYSATNVLVGQISLIGEDTSDKDSGFLILIPISGVVGQLINQAKD